MLNEIRSYCDFTIYEAKVYQPVKKSDPDLIVPPAPLKFREATQSEVGRIKGEALLLAKNTKAARTELIAPYMRGEREPDLLAALGMFERTNGEPDRARKFLEAAYTAKSKRTDANVELARIRYDEAVKKLPVNGRLSPVQVAGILGPLQLARGQPPPSLALYELAADTWTRAEMKPKKDDVSMLIEGAMLFPTRLKLVYQAGAMAAEAGELRAAHALADHGIKYGPDANVKKRFEDLKASLPPAPPPEPDAKAAPAEPKK
jgi:hypothetical protein